MYVVDQITQCSGMCIVLAPFTSKIRKVFYPKRVSVYFYTLHCLKLCDFHFLQCIFKFTRVSVHFYTLHYKHSLSIRNAPGPSQGLKIWGGSQYYGGHNLPPWLRQGQLLGQTLGGLAPPPSPHLATALRSYKKRPIKFFNHKN